MVDPPVGATVSDKTPLQFAMVVLHQRDALRRRADRNLRLSGGALGALWYAAGWEWAVGWAALILLVFWRDHREDERFNREHNEALDKVRVS